MEVSKITTGSIEAPQTAVNMKGKMQDTVPQTEEKDPKDALTNPMETVGRSQVQFRGTLSSNDLNYISESVARLQLNKEDITTLKKALANTLKKYNCADISEFNKKIGGKMDDSLDFMMDVLKEAEKINPDANLDKIGLVANSIF